jgi:TonB family protein
MRTKTTRYVLMCWASVFCGLIPVATAASQEATAVRPGGDVYFEFQVAKQVSVLPGNPAPRYPDMMRSSNVEGRVLAQFVVDTLGQADTLTFKILRSTDPMFTSSVRAVLPSLRFSPAEIAGGRKVKQLVQMPFEFSITRSAPAKPPRE